MRTVQLFMLLCCVAGSAQQTEKIVFADIDSIRFYERFMIEAGMRMPLGSLADKVGASPEFGFWFRSRMRNSDMFDLGFSVYVPTQVKDFKYTDRGNTYNVKASGASGMAGFRVNKMYTLGGTRFKKSVEWTSSFGYAFFMYRDRYQPEIENPTIQMSEVNILKSFSTFHIGQGIRFNIDNVGLQANYSYTPYAQFSNHVTNDFGAHSVTVSLAYRQ